MSFYDLIGMSIGNLRRRKLRTFLTVLGVLIGTTSIVAMLSLALGMKQMIMEQYSQMGSMTQITVTSGGDQEGSSTDTATLLTDTNMALFEGMEHIQSVVPQLTFGGTMNCGKYQGWASLTGVGKDVLESQELECGEIPAGEGGSLKLLAGNQILTSFSYMEGDEYVDYYSTGELPDIDLMTQVKQIQVYDESSMDTEMSSDLTEDDEEDTDVDGEDDTAASVIENNGMKTFCVDITGIMAGGVESYNQYSYNLLTDVDSLKSYLLKNFGRGNIPGQPKVNGRPLNEWVYTAFTVNVDSADNVESVMSDIQDMGFQAESNKELLQSAQKSLQIVELVLGGIGMVAFLVAAIGIANTMMMSTYERTKEIGIMKVLGCDMRDIQKLFLAEAGFIGFSGGVVGLGLTYIISLVINRAVMSMMEDQFMSGNISVIPWWLAVVAVVFSTIMGMLAGYFPARRAMKLSPLAAIRTE
jgi:ABC-type antimicrobial peptide transport system permease subunit